MTVRVGINGFGRIGRNFFRAVDAQKALGTTDIEIVAVNDLTDNATLAHLLKYDSILGRLPHGVSLEGDDTIVVGDTKIKALAHRGPLSELPWGDLGVDVVVESTGIFTDAEKAKGHLEAGAEKVVISAPAKGEDITIVMGVNDDKYDGSQNIISNASCTTNCLGPIAKVLDDEFGIVKGLMTTVHAYTQDQNLQDGPHRDLRRARAAALNVVPTSTVPPRPSAWSSRSCRQAGRIRVARADPDGLGHRPHRQPVETGHDCGDQRRHEVCRRGPAEGHPEVHRGTIVSSDIVTDPHSSIFDAGLTKVIDDQAKVVSWYDNEWGYSNRLADLVGLVAKSL